ncbi:Ferric/cupric reductase transmembrane component 2 [Pleurostoma richardsiae]|uniref:Ferric/cupric reductase transmembrane component 2 n=1 Tax=Pleurostoma richardsiae TaxID=41990 RepID=A0AA38S5D6_9PEZI|nr:Ferric/cupric reductase transmembrane component 2 [Pleurostoma richardsiae]
MWAIFAKRLLVNKRHLRIYAGVICGVIAVFVFFHWTRLLFARKQRMSRSAALTAVATPFVFVSRGVRSILIRNLPGFTSVGHALLVATYVAINAALTFTDVDLTSPGSIANRFGWMLSANFAVVVFLALKNTPLAFLTAYSYERLNVLHQIAGYMAVLYLVLHAVTYTAFFGSEGKWHILREQEQIAGIVAGFGFLGVFVSAAIVRRFWYEAFYITHIMSFIVAVICAAFHKPNLKTSIVTIMIITAALWATDRAIRAARVACYAINNSATVYPLPHGGTRIVMAKKPLGAVPGKHCFLWIPRIRGLEMHPFTVVSTQPMEFIVNSYDGFTRDLHKYARRHPGATLRASMDGPYGTFPDPIEYDKVVLIAGGSGASFTFGVACNLLERMGAEAQKNITFIWVVKKHDSLTWFSDHLHTLRTHAHSPKVSVSLFVTRAPTSPAVDEQRRGAVTVHPGIPHVSSASSRSSSDAQSPVSPTSGDVEKALAEAGLPLPPRAAATPLRDLSNKSSNIDEKAVLETAEARGGAQPAAVGSSETLAPPRAGHPVTAGRPDAATLITEAVRDTPQGQRVLVAACGPDGLMRVVRDAAARCIRGDGPAVELHCEQFGW